MTPHALLLDKMFMSSLKDILCNSKYFYKSSVGKGYSKLNDEGINAVTVLVNLFGHEILEEQKNSLNERAMNMTMEVLSNP